MNKEAAKKLNDVAWQAAENFSSDREFNYDHELFTIHSILPMGDMDAAVIMEKTGGKRSLFHFWWQNNNGGRWYYRVPTDSHLLQMNYLWQQVKCQVEQHNFEFNFKNKMVVN